MGSKENINILDLDEYFLNKEKSKKLVSLGFNEPCIFYFDDFDQNFGNITHSNNGDYVKSNPKNLMVPRPTYDQAFNWFRREFGLESNVLSHSTGNDNKLSYFFNIEQYNGSNFICEKFNCIDKHRRLFYEHHDKAKYECLNKLIEIVEKTLNHE